MTGKMDYMHHIVDNTNELLEAKRAGVTHVQLEGREKPVSIETVLMALALMAFEENIDIAGRALKQRKRSDKK